MVTRDSNAKGEIFKIDKQLLSELAINQQEYM
jgi:hypothetical protein